MVILRGHHLICLNFFHGEGYDEKFIKSLGYVLDRAEEEGVSVTPDADEVCRACSWLKDGRCGFGEDSDKEIRDMDKRAIELLGLLPGDKVHWDMIRERLPAIFSHWFSLYCTDCNWRASCEKDRLYTSLKDDVR